MKKKELNLFFGLFIFVILLSCKTNMITNQDKIDLTKVNRHDTIVSSQSYLKKGSFKYCLEVVEEILTTSPRYIELTIGLKKVIIKNGGISFGISLEGSPNPINDDALAYSKTYDYNIHEIYLDRISVMARFTFDPEKKQLFEYDVINDKLKMIDFDRGLLIITNRLCD